MTIIPLIKRQGGRQQAARGIEKHGDSPSVALASHRVQEPLSGGLRPMFRSAPEHKQSFPPAPCPLPPASLLRCFHPIAFKLEVVSPNHNK
ncbi:hypothetical protein CDG77_00550 [Nostoc sp. 'Peltigera membranacea cyanobiont' 213]|nr:hypothetical protein CDG77_00550 [Nostoc sp. 'Peltigera membranacea cyanobiont' 213]